VWRSPRIWAKEMVKCRRLLPVYMPQNGSPRIGIRPESFYAPGRHMKEAKNAFDTEHALHTFSIGIQGSPDLIAARKVADFLGTEHHEFTFTVDEGIDALYDLIWHIESYEQVRRCFLYGKGSSCCISDCSHCLIWWLPRTGRLSGNGAP